MNETYAAWLVAAGLTTLVTAAVAWRQRTAPGALPLVGLLLSITQWTLAYAMHWLAPDPSVARAWLDATFVGVVLCPVFVSMMTLGMTGRRVRFTPASLLAHLGVPVITLALLVTDPSHGLLFGTPREENVHTLLEGGPWFPVVVVHGYALIALSLVRLAVAYRRASRLYQRQIALVLAGLVLPWSINIVSVLGSRPFPDLDLTPIIFGLSALTFLVALVSVRLFDIVPVARHTLVEHMTEGVVVLDTEHRVLDLNPAACAVTRTTLSDAVGRHARDVFAAFEPTFSELLVTPGQSREVRLPGSARHALDLHVTPLHDGRGRTRGHLVTWRDVTELRAAHEELHARMQHIEHLQRQLYEHSVRDALTGLHNRRHLDVVLDATHDQARRSGRPYAVVFVDIDHFKRVNDTVGHAAGDQVLTRVGQCLLALLHDHETLGRYGGEEFLVVLPGLTTAQARDRAEGWRAALESERIVVDGRRVPITASLGVASYPKDASDVNLVLAAADRALYDAKRHGRNRVESH